MMRLRRFFLGAAWLMSACVVAGCQTVPTMGLPIHRIDIQQGNVVTQEMVEKLRPGMTRQQVRFILGTPPLVDPFRVDRWDYVYYYSKAGTVTEHRRLVLLFDADILKRIDGDVVPSAADKSKTAPKPGAIPEPNDKPQAAAPAEFTPGAKPAAVPGP